MGFWDKIKKGFKRVGHVFKEGFKGMGHGFKTAYHKTHRWIKRHKTIANAAKDVGEFAMNFIPGGGAIKDIGEKAYKYGKMIHGHAKKAHHIYQKIKAHIPESMRKHLGDIEDKAKSVFRQGKKTSSTAGKKKYLSSDYLQSRKRDVQSVSKLATNVSKKYRTSKIRKPKSKSKSKYRDIRRITKPDIGGEGWLMG